MHISGYLVVASHRLSEARMHELPSTTVVLPDSFFGGPPLQSTRAARCASVILIGWPPTQVYALG